MIETASSAFAQALHYDELARAYSADDPGLRHCLGEVNYWLDLAASLEIKERCRRG